MSRSTALQRAAQMADAGSCITIIRQTYKDRPRPSYRLQFILRRTEKNDLEEFIGLVGVAGHIRRTQNNGLSYHELNFGSESAAMVLEQLLPMLSARAKEAELAVRFWHGSNLGGGGNFEGTPEELHVWREARHQEMQELKASLKGRGRHHSPNRPARRPS